MDKTPRTLLKGVVKGNASKGKDEPKDAIKGFITKSSNATQKPASPALTSTPIKVATPSGKREAPGSARHSNEVKKISSSSVDASSNDKTGISILDSFLIWLNLFLFVGIILTIAALALFVLTLNKVE